MLNVSDTAIRLYRKSNGLVSVRWHTYLMIKTNGNNFKLASYLNHISINLTLQSGESIELDHISFSYECDQIGLGYMVYEMRASGTTSMVKIIDTLGTLRMEYHLFSFPGQGNPSAIETIVPVLARGRRNQR